MSTNLDDINRAVVELADDKFLVDPYMNWATGEGIPIVEDFGIDLKTVETKPWPRMVCWLVLVCC